MENPIKTFRSPINRENSFGIIALADDIESTMEMYKNNDGGCMIEWNIEELNETVQICIFVEENTKTICDYDGVFEVPKQAIEFLQEQGFNTDYLTD